MMPTRILALFVAVLVLSAGAARAVDPVIEDTPKPAPAPKKPKPRPVRRQPVKQLPAPAPVRPAPAAPPAPDPVKADWESTGALLDSSGFNQARDTVAAAKLDSRGRNSAEVSQKFARLAAECTALLRRIRAMRPRTELVRYYLDQYGRALERMGPPTQRFADLLAARDWNAIQREGDGVTEKLKGAGALTEQANEYFTRVVQPHLR